VVDLVLGAPNVNVTELAGLWVNLLPTHPHPHGEVLGAKRRASNHALPSMELVSKTVGGDNQRLG
jgi:hypothetical protein